MEQKKLNKRSISIMLMLVLVVGIMGVVFVLSSAHKDRMNAKIESNALADASVIGESGNVSHAVITSRNTGTDVFDTTEGPGNDVSASDSIVRSFDKVKWLIDVNMAIKEGVTLNSLQGGCINIEIKLPESCADVVKWDTNLMNWAQDVQEYTDSNNNYVFKAKYYMDENKVTVPGKQSLEVALDVKNAMNGQEITPEFKVWLEGNEESEAYSFNDLDQITVSAAPKYNLALVRSEQIYEKTTVNYDGNDILGRIYGYGVKLQLFNDSPEKGLKGVEVPKDNIKFDIDLNFLNGSEDITDDCTPLLWNYKLNDYSSNGKIDGRNMFFSNRLMSGLAPLGRAYNREESVYDSGDFTMTQNGNKISVEFTGYKFDGVFPKYNYYWDNYTHAETPYSDNIGNFAVGYFQILMPYNEHNTNETGDYYLKVSDSNLNTKSLSDISVNTQMKTDDDSITTKHHVTYKGYASQELRLVDNDNNDLNRTIYDDASAYPGSDFFIYSKFAIDQNSEVVINSADRVVKFDGDVIAPKTFENGEKYRKKNFNGNMEFNVWYLCKKDGTNWTDKTELKNTNVKDLDRYENISDIPENKICVGVFFESNAGVINPSKFSEIYFPATVKQTATIGDVGEVVCNTWLWEENLDRSVYTIENDNEVTYPSTTFSSINFDYQPTVYDDEGHIIDYEESRKNWGESLLVVSANQKLEIETLNINTNEAKNSFNIEKNETSLKYKLTPKLEKAYNSTSDIEDVTVKVTYTLPDGLSYVPNSFDKEQYENTSNHNCDFEFSKNEENGETTLVWNIHGCSVGDEIDPLYFDVDINENTLNDTTYTSTGIISADKDKVGNIETSLRTFRNDIIVINLSSHRLYKTVETPIIEKDGVVEYTLTYSNNTDQDVNAFQLLDILPYNTSASEKTFDGDYKLEKINIVQRDKQGNVKDNTVDIYVSNDISARNVKANDTNIGVSNIWQRVENNTNINSEVTAFAVKGNVEKNSEVYIVFSLKTNGNKEGDRYLNRATARVNENATDNELIETTEVEAKVVSRKISGMIWEDTNENGIKDQNESYKSNVDVIVKNEAGEEITRGKTNQDGYYEFSSLPKSNFIIQIDTESKYKLTQKDVGEDLAINSKFSEVNGNKQSDVITVLNSIDSPEITQNNINAGLVLKDSKVKVKYLDENGNEIKYKEVNPEGIEEEKSYSYDIEGKIGTNYTTEQLEIEGYKFINSQGNTTGNIAETETEVIYNYAYNKRDIEVTNIWIDNNNEAQKRPGSVTIELYADDVLVNSYNFIDTTDNSQKHTFKNLEKYNADNSEKVYKVGIKENNEGDLKFYTTDINNTDFVITNRFAVPDDKKEIEAKIVWIDNNNANEKRPEKVILELYANNVLKESVEIDAINGERQTYDFGEYPKYDNLGNEIVYTIDEKEKVADDLKFYAKEVNNETYTITNRFAVPDDKIDITATLKWIDNDNENDSRPNSITIYLKNKDEIVRSFTLDEIPTTYTHIFKDIVKYDEQGNEIEYTLYEEDIEGYDKEITNMLIENTIKEYSITAEVEGEGGEITDGNEEVNYKGKSTKEIKATPNKGYEVNEIKVNGNSIDFEANENGEVVLDKFVNVKEDKEVKVTFKRKEMRVLVNYITEEGEIIAKQEEIKGVYEDDYETEEKEFDNYDLKEIVGNTSGKMLEDTTIVTYKYAEVKGSIKITVVDKSDNTILLEGAKFKVYKLDENGEIFEEKEYTSNELGEIEISGLPIGKYKIKQIGATNGYEIDENEYDLEITKSDRDHVLKIENIKIKEDLVNANTGDIIVKVVVILAVAVVLFVLTMVLSKKRKKNK